MGIINILDDSIANIIAAGEVVENPAAMIKELVENSLDAKANKISLDIDTNFDLKIVDNGVGMDRNDLVLSIERHATSKIKEKKDVFNVHTYGFRGEALASIAAVSKIQMTSKQEGQNAYKMIAYAGKIIEVTQVNANVGTSIEIRDLFYNTPARKKFLRKESTEINKIKDVILKEALANYNVAFELKIASKVVFKTTGQGLDKTVFEIFGKNNYKNLDKFNLGFLGNVEAVKSTKDYIFTYVNGRYVKSNILDRAIISGYDTKLMKGKYPFVILFLEISPTEIDINIDPSKRYIKFSQEAMIYNMIVKEIKDYFYVMDRKNWRPSIAEPQKAYEYEPKEMVEIKDSNFSFPMLKNSSNYGNTKETHFEKQIGIFEKSDGTNKKYDVLGQIFNTYILVNNTETDELEIYDQHIIHEGILFNELMEKASQKKMNSKQLLVPRLVSLMPKERQIVFDNYNIFEEYGFEIDEASENEVLIRSVPDFDFRHPMENVFKELIDSIIINEFDIQDIRREILTSMSCKGAIKAGDKLTMYEMQNMVRRLHEVNRYTCPHGRPIIAKISKEDLDKKFGRIK